MIQLATGFEVLTNLPIDSRTLMTKEEMLNINENIFPEYFLTQCVDDEGKLYIYNRNGVSNPTTGKFTALADSFGDSLQKEVLPTAGADEVGNIYQYVGETQADTELYKGCWYICEGTEKDGYSWKNILTDPPLVLNEITNELDPEFIAGGLKTITLTQGSKLVGKFSISKDLVTESGKVQIISVEKPTEDDDSTWIYTLVGTDPAETYTKADTLDEKSNYYKYPLVASTYIMLGIRNQSYPIFIDSKTIVSDKLGTVTETVTANVEVGGISVGDKVQEGEDITSLVKKLLIKYYPPVITLSSTPTNKVVERGVDINVELSATVTKKSNSITNVSFYKNDSVINEVAEDVSNGGTFVHTVPDSITETTTFKATATDGSKTVESKVTYTFVNPYYYGVIDSVDNVNEGTILGLTKLVEVKGKKTLSFTGDNQFSVFAYDKSYGALKSLVDMNGFDNLSSFSSSVVSVGGVDYLVYISNTPLTATNFKYTFE